MIVIGAARRRRERRRRVGAVARRAAQPEHRGRPRARARRPLRLDRLRDRRRDHPHRRLRRWPTRSPPCSSSRSCCARAGGCCATPRGCCSRARRRGIDPEQVGRSLAAQTGVVEVHDLHLWEVTTGFPALAAHVVVAPDEDCHARRRELQTLLRDRFGIEHVDAPGRSRDRPRSAPADRGLRAARGLTARLRVQERGAAAANRLRADAPSPPAHRARELRRGGHLAARLRDRRRRRGAVRGGRGAAAAAGTRRCTATGPLTDRFVAERAEPADARARVPGRGAGPAVRGRRRRVPARAGRDEGPDRRRAAAPTSRCGCSSHGSSATPTSSSSPRSASTARARARGRAARGRRGVRRRRAARWASPSARARCRSATGCSSCAPDALDDAPGDALRIDRATVACSRSSAHPERPGAPGAHATAIRRLRADAACAAPLRRRRARAGRVAWARTDGRRRGWPSRCRAAARARGLPGPGEAEDPLRAFCSLVARRSRAPARSAGRCAASARLRPRRRRSRRSRTGCSRPGAARARGHGQRAGWPSGSPRSAPSRTTRGARGRASRQAVALERAAIGRPRPRRPDGSTRSSPSSATACARCCATCSAGTSTPTCAGLADGCVAQAALETTLAPPGRARPGPGVGHEDADRRRRARASTRSTASASRRASTSTSRSASATSPARRSAERRRRSSAPRDLRRRSSGRACTRLTMIPPNGIPRLAQPAVEEDRLLDRLALGARDEQERRAGVAPAACLTPAARSRNPSIRPLERAEERRERSSSRSTPVTRCRTRERRRPCPGRCTRPPSPVGARNDLQRAAVEEAVRRSGASRKSSALRDGGVSSTTTSQRAVAVQLVELGDGGELLRARHRARELAVDAVGRGPRRAALSSGASSSMSSSNVRLASSSSPTARPPSLERASTRCGSLPSSSSPSAVGEPAARGRSSRPRPACRSAASPSARAADVVVLPTPPEPAR